MQLWQQRPQDAEQINSRAAELRRTRLTRDAAGARRRIKVSVVLGEAAHRALAQARIEDGIPAAERIRAAVHQWQTDPRFRAAVDELAADLRRQRFADRAASRPPDPDLARTAS